MINRDLKKMQEQSFFHDMQARFDQQEKNFTCEALLFQKKRKEFLPFFQNLYFPDFFQVWKIAGQIPTLFQEFKTLKNRQKSKLYELVHTTIENSK